VQLGDWITDERVRLLAAGLLPQSTATDQAQYRAIALLSQQVRAQAYTLATSDSFTLIAWVAAAYLLLMLFLRPNKISYADLRKMK
jgi:DHA2 family multidrug resistance protein